MSIVTDFQARLRAIEPPVFRLVAGAAEFAAIDAAPKASPAAIVFIEREASEENNRALGGPVLQRSEIDVAVIIITRNVSDATGGAAAQDIDALKEKVRAALIGMVPTSSVGGTPVEHLEGELLRARGGWIWQREVFAAVTYIGEAE